MFRILLAIVLLLPPGAALAVGAAAQEPPPSAVRGEPAAPAAEPAASAAGACGPGTLVRITIRNHSLFAPDEISDRDFAWALGLANWAHVRTRERFLRREMLVREGTCFDPFLIRESERLIRELDFIARVEARPLQVSDSTWHLEVETWDEWTTQLSVDFDVERAVQFKGVSLTEQNLGGRGLRLALRYRDFQEHTDRGLALATRRLLGTRAVGTVEGGTNRVGSFVRAGVRYPWVGESGRFHLDARVRLDDREHLFRTGDLDGVSHVLVPLTDRRGTLVAERRFGRPGALRVLGVHAEWVDQEALGAPQRVLAQDFGRRAPAPGDVADTVDPQARPERYLSAGIGVGMRRVRFSTARGLDLISSPQNVATGSEARIALGHSLYTSDHRGGFAWVRAGAWGGFARGWLTGNVSGEVEASRLDAPAAGSSPWRDVTARGGVNLWIQPGGDPRSVLFVSARIDAHRAMDRLEQRTLGGELGVRAWIEEELPAATTFVVRAEERLNLDWAAPAVDLGVAIFGDAGRGWAGDVPFGVDSGWRASVGGALRLGFPAGSGSITHLEMAWPVAGAETGRAPVFRTYWSPVRTSR